jgi:peroxisomal 3,2-trans-enoyl-CoA isomerase
LTGDFYSSGNDLSLFLKAGGDVKSLADQAGETMIKFVDAFIDCEKPIIAAINGHAVGILVTTLGLCDTVIASDKATFLTPFGSTAQVPEGCSTYTFPRLMGYSMASQMLLFNQKLTAQQALTHGLIGKVVPDSEFQTYLEEFKKNVDENCAMHSLVWGKKLMRPEHIKQEQRKANREEAELLKKSWFTPEFPKFIGKFFQRKK